MSNQISHLIEKNDFGKIMLVSPKNIELFITKLSESIGYDVKVAPSPAFEENEKDFWCKSLVMDHVIPLESIQDSAEMNENLDADSFIYEPIIKEIVKYSKIQKMTHLLSIETTGALNHNPETFQPYYEIILRGAFENV